MPSRPTSRRPLKTRTHHWAQAPATVWARRRVARHFISLASLVRASLGATALGASPFGSSAPRAWRLLIAVRAVPVWLLCNLLDGMVAVEGGMGGPFGEVWNDLQDRVADAPVLVGTGYACGWPELGRGAVPLAVLTAHGRQLGRAAGLPQRMALQTGALLVPWGWERPVMEAMPGLLVLGTAWTPACRIRDPIPELEAR